LLCRPGKKKLGLNQIPLEKRDDPLAELCDFAGAPCTHHDAIRVLCAQGRLALSLCRCVANVIDLVENADARQDSRTNLLKYSICYLKLALKPGVACIDDVEQQGCIKCLV
jgi:hypothetical protein